MLQAMVHLSQSLDIIHYFVAMNPLPKDKETDDDIISIPWRFDLSVRRATICTRWFLNSVGTILCNWSWWNTGPRVCSAVHHEFAAQSIGRGSGPAAPEMICRLAHLRLRDPDNQCYIVIALRSQLWASLIQDDTISCIGDIGRKFWPISWCMKGTNLCRFSHRRHLGTSCLPDSWSKNYVQIYYFKPLLKGQSSYFPNISQKSIYIYI